MRPGGARPAGAPVTGIASPPKAFSGSLHGPGQRLPAQWLRLDGISGDVESAQR